MAVGLKRVKKSPIFIYWQLSGYNFSLPQLKTVERQEENENLYSCDWFQDFHSASLVKRRILLGLGKHRNSVAANAVLSQLQLFPLPIQTLNSSFILKRKCLTLRFTLIPLFAFFTVLSSIVDQLFQ